MVNSAAAHCTLTPTTRRVAICSLAADVGAVLAIGVGVLRGDDKEHLVGCGDGVRALRAAAAANCTLKQQQGAAAAAAKRDGKDKHKTIKHNTSRENRHSMTVCV